MTISFLGHSTNLSHNVLNWVIDAFLRPIIGNDTFTDGRKLSVHIHIIGCYLTCLGGKKTFVKKFVACQKNHCLNPKYKQHRTELASENTHMNLAIRRTLMPLHFNFFFHQKPSVCYKTPQNSSLAFCLQNCIKRKKINVLLALGQSQ